MQESSRERRHRLKASLVKMACEVHSGGAGVNAGSFRRPQPLLRTSVRRTRSAGNTGGTAVYPSRFTGRFFYFIILLPSIYEKLPYIRR